MKGKGTCVVLVEVVVSETVQTYNQIIVTRSRYIPVEVEVVEEVSVVVVDTVVVPGSIVAVVVSVAVASTSDTVCVVVAVAVVGRWRN
jgi:hypothetical protein